MSRHKYPSDLLTGEPILLMPRLAVLLSVNEAIILQQIAYWLKRNVEANRNFREGRHWTYNTYDKWREENFPFWSVKTIKRTMDKLKSRGLVITTNKYSIGIDRTLWFTIDFEVLNVLENEQPTQTDHLVYPDCLDEEDTLNSPSSQVDQIFTETSPETFPETSSETLKKTKTKTEDFSDFFIKQKPCSDTLSNCNLYKVEAASAVEAMWPELEKRLADTAWAGVPLSSLAMNYMGINQKFSDQVFAGEYNHQIMQVILQAFLARYFRTNERPNISTKYLRDRYIKGGEAATFLRADCLIAMITIGIEREIDFVKKGRMRLIEKTICSWDDRLVKRGRCITQFIDYVGCVLASDDWWDQPGNEKLPLAKLSSMLTDYEEDAG